MQKDDQNDKSGTVFTLSPSHGIKINELHLNMGRVPFSLAVLVKETQVVVIFLHI